MKIGQVKAAINAAMTHGDTKRGWTKRTALNDLSIHAFEALIGVLPTHDNELSDAELSTILGQVGYIFAKLYPVTAGSPADETWGNFLTALLSQTSDTDADGTHNSTETVSKIKALQRGQSTEGLTINIDNVPLTIKAASLNADECLSEAQTLSAQIEATLKSYYRQKNTSTINPAIVALEKLNLELMGRVLSNASIDIGAYKTSISTIFTSKTVRAGTLWSDTSYKVWQALSQTLDLNKSAPPVDSASRPLSSKGSAKSGFNLFKPSTWSWSWFSSSNDAESSATAPMSASTTPRNSNVSVQVETPKQRLNTQLGLPNEADIWKSNTSHAEVLSQLIAAPVDETLEAIEHVDVAIEAAVTLNLEALVDHVDADKLQQQYAKWESTPHKDFFCQQMITGLLDNSQAFKTTDDNFRIALIRQWPAENKNRLFAHIHTWENVSSAIYQACVQKFSASPEAFKGRPEAFQVGLVQHWPMDQSTALFQHTAQWHGLISQPHTVTQAINQFIAVQTNIITETQPQGHVALLNQVNTWYPDIRQAPHQIMQAIIQQCRTNKAAFSQQSPELKATLIEKWPIVDSVNDMTALLTHIRTWHPDNTALPSIEAEALSAKIKTFIDSDRSEITAFRITAYEDYLDALFSTGNTTIEGSVLETVATAIFDMKGFIDKLGYTTPEKINKDAIIKTLKSQIGSLDVSSRSCALSYIRKVRESDKASDFPILNDARRERGITRSVCQEVKFNPAASEKTLKAVIEFNYTLARQVKLVV